MKKTGSAPFVHSRETRFTVAVDRLIALAPVLLWSVYIFGARVLTFCVVTVGLCFALDYAVQRFIIRLPKRALIDPENAVYGLLTAFVLPVAAPLWVPMIAAILTVAAKNVRLPSGRRLFSPFIFSAAVMNIVFRGTMSVFTRPGAYFNALSFIVDPNLIANYRVISPLQYIANGSVYEGGVVPQLIGYAAGNIGEIAIAAIMIGSVWLFVRKRADLRGTLAMLGVIFFLAYFFPSDDAEESFYVFSMLFSGAIPFIAFFALNDGASLPATHSGRFIAGALCGLLIFIFRKLGGGYEWGYLVVLGVDALSPLIEKYTLPRPAGAAKRKKKARRV